MPPNTNDAPDQNQPVSTPPAEPATANSQNPQNPVDDTVPPTVIPQTQEAKSETPPITESDGPTETPQDTPVAPEVTTEPPSSDLASPPPVNEAAMPANNRLTLDTINTQPEQVSDSLETEIDKLPDTTSIENPEPEQEPSAPATHTDSPLEAAATAEPIPTPSAFPETASESQEPKKKGFFSKFFKHK